MKTYFGLICLSLYLMGTTLGFAESDKKSDHPSNPVIMAAAGTSYGAGSSSALALLTSEGGNWIPQSEDAAVNEGLYFQFEEPIAVSYISILAELPESNSDESDYRLAAYLNGMVFPVSQISEKEGKVLYRITDAGEEAIEPLIKSLFIRLDGSNSSKKPLKILAIKFLDNNEKVIPLKLPEAVTAKVKATSTLSPEFAYSPDHLFDSQFDIAWSTNGKKNNGINESVTVELPEKHNIKGLIIWNGYQRSNIHYRANGRVKKLAVNDQLITVKDSQEPQQILLPKAVDSDTLTLTIKEIYKGDAYNDVLISELRFLTNSGDILLPLVQQKKTEFPASLSFMRDVSYSSLIDTVGIYDVEDPDYGSGPDDVVHKYDIGAIRLRSNGSFVIYKNQEDKALLSASNTNVMEGNWEVTGSNSIRLFGKKYSVSMYDSSTSDYLRRQQKEQDSNNTIKLPMPKIFQSTAVISRYNDLSEKERKNILNFLLDNLKVTPKMRANAAANGNANPFVITARFCDEWEQRVFTADSLEKVRDKFYKRLVTINPVYIKSDVFTQLLIPQDEINLCSY